MKQHYIDEKTGISYTLQGDYYLPDLVLPAEKEQNIGIWGQRHLRYLKEYRRITYLNLLTSGRLNSFLTDIDEQAQDMFSRLVKQLAEKEDVTETLKANNQMLWVQKMGSIQNRAREIVNVELIFQ